MVEIWSSAYKSEALPEKTDKTENALGSPNKFLLDVRSLAFSKMATAINLGVIEDEKKIEIGRERMKNNKIITLLDHRTLAIWPTSISSLTNSAFLSGYI